MWSPSFSFKALTTTAGNLAASLAVMEQEVALAAGQGVEVDAVAAAVEAQAVVCGLTRST